MRRTFLLALVGAVLLTGPVPATGAAEASPPAAPPVGQAADDALTEALEDNHISAARYALERARSLFAPRRVERRYGEVDEPAPREATLLLRDLALRVDALAPEAAEAAQRLLARPTVGSTQQWETGYRTTNTARVCGPHICVHWARDTTDAPPPADGDADGVPDWVQTTARVLGRVWRTEVGAYGYRRPRSDVESPDNGGDGRLDVYLADTGAYGTYGYCTTDDPRIGDRWDVSAYCVVDDDFSGTQFPAASPVENLRVTAAHEFFHAAQFGYDITEDRWLMEGTAAWIEDEVFDGVDDNHQYLRTGPLARPHVSLDRGVYGPWVFFRFMAEYFGTTTADRPVVVREIWRRADAAAGGPDDYSLQAVANVSRARHVPFRALFADFGRTGPFAGALYDEGRSYPQAPMTRRHPLTLSDPGTGARAVTLHHLANRHVSLVPGRSLPARRRLRVGLNLPGRVRGSAATVTVVRRSGDIRAFPVALNRRGNGTRTVGFSRGRVARVVLTLSNASTRMRCWQRTWLACEGVSRDDGLRFAYHARAVR